MKLKPIAANVNAATLNSGAVILFSYQTPVAAFIPGEGYFRTEHKWSVTTSKHITQWLNKEGATAKGTKPQAFFDALGEAA